LKPILYKITCCPASSGEGWLTCGTGFLVRCQVYYKAYRGDEVESLLLK
jgi:hypothetical protein